jgi:hypothetical protein
MDFNALQHKLFAMDPVDPREDIARMKAQAAAPAVESDGIDYLKESAVVPEGSLQMDRDYSVNDFAALAGVTITESQRTGSAGQAKANAPMPLAKPGRTTHPLKDKLVGECADDTIRIEKLEDKIKSLEAIVIKLAAKAGLVERELSNDEEKEKERIVTGMKKNKSDFKDRYGNDAEAVMYATATKRAKQNASVDYSSDIKTRLYDALNKKMGV